MRAGPSFFKTCSTPFMTLPSAIPNSLYFKQCCSFWSLLQTTQNRESSRETVAHSRKFSRSTYASPERFQTASLRSGAMRPARARDCFMFARSLQHPAEALTLGSASSEVAFPAPTRARNPARISCDFKPPGRRYHYDFLCQTQFATCFHPTKHDMPETLQ